MLLVSYEEISRERVQTIKDLEEFEVERWTPEKKYETAVNQYYFLLDQRGIHTYWQTYILSFFSVTPPYCKRTKTVDDEDCLVWKNVPNQTFGHWDHNLCKNPDQDTGGDWCFVENDNLNYKNWKPWNYCGPTQVICGKDLLWHKEVTCMFKIKFLFSLYYAEMVLDQWGKELNLLTKTITVLAMENVSHISWRVWWI